MTSHDRQGNKKKAFQFFINLISYEEEKLLYTSYKEFEKIVIDRVFGVMTDVRKMNKTLLPGELKKENFALRIFKDDKWLMVVNIDSTEETGMGLIFRELIDGPGYFDLSLSEIKAEYYNEEEDIWKIWRYSGSVGCHESEEVIYQFWPPLDDYEPFIRYEDYKTFDENKDNLNDCLESFKEHFPEFLRSRWNDNYQDDISKIEGSEVPIDTFNALIGYPGNMGFSIIDDLFTGPCCDTGELNNLDENIYTLFGYFYGIHLRHEEEDPHGITV